MPAPSCAAGTAPRDALGAVRRCPDRPSTSALAERLARGGAGGAIPNCRIVVPNCAGAAPAPAPSTRSHPRRRPACRRTTRIVLFQGRLGPEPRPRRGRRGHPARPRRGAGPARVRALVRARASRATRDPRFAGRHVTLPARPPGRAARVDRRPPTSPSSRCRRSRPTSGRRRRTSSGRRSPRGRRSSSAPGLDVMARLVTEHELGVVARSLAPDDLAAAIRSRARPAGGRARRRAPPDPDGRRGAVLLARRRGRVPRPRARSAGEGRHGAARRMIPDRW